MFIIAGGICRTKIVYGTEYFFLLKVVGRKSLVESMVRLHLLSWYCEDAFGTPWFQEQLQLELTHMATDGEDTSTQCP